MESISKRLYKRLVVQRNFQNQSCIDCGEKNWKLLENDHISNDKSKDSNGNSIRTISNNSTVSDVINEIKKCEPVCIWCHRKRTHAKFSLEPKRSYSNLSVDKYKQQRRGVSNQKKLEVGSCVSCNIKVNVGEEYLFDWDHIDPETKQDCVSNLIKDLKPNTEIIEEIKKCQLLCCKCHRLKNRVDNNWIDIETVDKNIIAEIDLLFLSSSSSSTTSSTTSSSTTSSSTTSSSTSSSTTSKSLTKKQKAHIQKRKDQTEKDFKVHEDTIVSYCNKCEINVPLIAMCSDGYWCKKCRRTWESDRAKKLIQGTWINIKDKVIAKKQRVESSGMKFCMKCNESLTVSNFSKSSRHTDGLQSWCKSCKTVYAEENKTALVENKTKDEQGNYQCKKCKEYFPAENMRTRKFYCITCKSESDKKFKTQKKSKMNPQEEGINE